MWRLVGRFGRVVSVFNAPNELHFVPNGFNRCGLVFIKEIYPNLNYV